ncbi:MAG: EF-P lysine aminoacylase GenX [Xanthomonadaceae bacterium]|nr:EF-P lysine aminoacylase GenX [Xanthomonadaceae bacterium]
MASWRPTATRAALAHRAELLRRTRAFFDARGALEVETPALAAAAPTDPHIASLYTEVAGAGGRWLQTSPEFPMKRLLAAGYGDCWQLARVLRDGEAGRVHCPEFSLLEWYRIGWDDAQLIDEVDALVRMLFDGHRAIGPIECIRYAAAFERATGVAFTAATPSTCASILIDAGASFPEQMPDAAWHDLVMGVVVAPTLGHNGPCFVTDYPAAQAALARLRDEDPAFAGRFELFIDGVEVANGYHELTDAAEQRQRFDTDNAARAAAGMPVMPVDEALLAALDAGLPGCAGVAVGFDRVVMLALGATSIAQVTAFGPPVGANL